MPAEQRGCDTGCHTNSFDANTFDFADVVESHSYFPQFFHEPSYFHSHSAVVLHNRSHNYHRNSSLRLRGLPRLVQSGRQTKKYQ